jgi:hypothetical protein
MGNQLIDCSWHLALYSCPLPSGPVLDIHLNEIRCCRVSPGYTLSPNPGLIKSSKDDFEGRVWEGILYNGLLLYGNNIC